MKQKFEQKIARLVHELYPASDTERLMAGLADLMDIYRDRLPSKAGERRFSQEDAVLITYGDMLHREGEAPLRILSEFLREYAAGLFSTVHVLPFFPYSSDDGFSVIDFKAVNPQLGDWEHIRQINQDFKLMVDLVINHISAESEWFRRFLKGEMPYDDFFITVEEGADLSAVVRPRALPLLTEFETAHGRRKVWTTFSADQIDLNYRNPQVLLAMIEVLLEYVRLGADIIRLDAVAYIWKEIGTACIHLPQAHAIVQLLRTLLDEIAPWVLLVTETNVPHTDNVSYFGDGTNEAQMVYNFSLPPLLLHTFISQNVRKLTRWAGGLKPPSDQTTFFNFLASHDGVGVTPALGILDPEEIDALVEHTLAQGGKVSYKHEPDGKKSPYELNINYLDALGNRADTGESEDYQARRFLTSQAIMLALQGVPGCYFHSLVGSRSWREGVDQLGHARAINRQKLALDALRTELRDGSSLRAMIFNGYRKLLAARRSHAAFHPQGEQKVLQLDQRVFALIRCAPHEEGCVVCLHNISAKKVTVRIDRKEIPAFGNGERKKILGEPVFQLDYQWLTVTLDAYESTWLEINPAL